MYIRLCYIGFQSSFFLHKEKVFFFNLGVVTLENIFYITNMQEINYISCKHNY